MPTGSDGAPPSCPQVRRWCPYRQRCDTKLKGPFGCYSGSVSHQHHLTSAFSYRILSKILTTIKPFWPCRSKKAACAQAYSAEQGSLGRALAGGGVGFDVPTLSSSDVVNASWAPVNITPVKCAGRGCETQWRGSVMIFHDRRVSRVNHSR